MYESYNLYLLNYVLAIEIVTFKEFGKGDSKVWIRKRFDKI